MLVEDFKGERVRDVRKSIQCILIQKNEAVLYREPEKTVISRSNDECVVALCDQWYFDYGEASWLSEAEKCLEAAITFRDDVRDSLMIALDRMRELACSRTYGLGTRIPWDEQYLIEALSDCTVHMAYYTVCYLLQGGVWEGNTLGPSKIRANDMSPEVWDYIFIKDKPYPKSCKIPKTTLDQLKTEFNYWYPVDVRMSGKDLIPSHLVYYIYGHTAIWPNESDKWPRGIRVNGHLLINSKKMSKSTGNFCTLEEAINKFSADGTRFALASAGDDVEDANFMEQMAEAGLLRLYSLVEWVREMIHIKDTLRTGPESEFTFNDKVFVSEMNLSINETKTNYENCLFKAALHTGLSEMQTYRDKYREVEIQGMHRDLVFRFIETQALLMAPICPHIAEHIWGLLGKDESIMKSLWPQAGPEDEKPNKESQYLMESAHEFCLSRKVVMNHGKAKVESLEIISSDVVEKKVNNDCLTEKPFVSYTTHVLYNIFFPLFNTLKQWFAFGL